MGIDLPRRGKQLSPGTTPIENQNVRCEQGHPAWRQVRGRCQDCPRAPIELTLLDGTVLTVDPDTVDAVTEWHLGTMILFRDRPSVSVRESRDEVMAKLD